MSFNCISVKKYSPGEFCGVTPCTMTIMFVCVSKKNSRVVKSGKGCLATGLFRAFNVQL